MLLNVKEGTNLVFYLEGEKEEGPGSDSRRLQGLVLGTENPGLCRSRIIMAPSFEAGLHG